MNNWNRILHDSIRRGAWVGNSMRPIAAALPQPAISTESPSDLMKTFLFSAKVGGSIWLFDFCVRVPLVGVRSVQSSQSWQGKIGRCFVKANPSTYICGVACVPPLLSIRSRCSGVFHRHGRLGVRPNRGIAAGPGRYGRRLLP